MVGSLGKLARESEPRASVWMTFFELPKTFTCTNVSLTTILFLLGRNITKKVKSRNIIPAIKM